jgi:hypothetical protein
MRPPVHVPPIALAWSLPLCRRDMNQSTGAPIVLTAPLTESIDHAGFFIQMSLAPRNARAIEECHCAVAPLVLFALLWLLDDPSAPSKRWAAPA